MIKNKIISLITAGTMIFALSVSAFAKEEPVSPVLGTDLYIETVSSESGRPMVMDMIDGNTEPFVNHRIAAYDHQKWHFEFRADLTVNGQNPVYTIQNWSGEYAKAQFNSNPPGVHASMLRVGFTADPSDPDDFWIVRNLNPGNDSGPYQIESRNHPGFFFDVQGGNPLPLTNVQLQSQAEGIPSAQQWWLYNWN